MFVSVGFTIDLKFFKFCFNHLQLNKLQYKLLIFDNIKLHKILSVVHLSGMITTNVLSEQAGKNVDMKKWHRAAGMTTFAAYAAAIASIKFEF